MSEFVELTNRYGKAIIGEQEAASASLAHHVTGGNVYGGAVMGDGIAHKGSGVYVSLDDLFNDLLKSPSSWNSLLSDELKRAGGPRLEALRIFLEVAEQQETPREALENLRTVITSHPDAALVEEPVKVPAPDGTDGGDVVVE